MKSSVEVILGDCRSVLPTLNRKFSFIFVDPPFNINHHYHEFTDRVPNDIFESQIQLTLSQCKKLLASNALLALHGPDHLASIYIRHAQILNLRFHQWIIWHYRFGQHTSTAFIPSHCHCIIYTPPCGPQSKPTFNFEAIKVPSLRLSKYNDPRTAQSSHKGYRPPYSVWGIEEDGPNWGRVQGNNAERRPHHPNQLPEKYIERLILVYTRVGDWVLDPYGGSGTTATVCQALSRNCTTIDISASNIESIHERLRKGTVNVFPTD